jgi:hypothetical protein
MNHGCRFSRQSYSGDVCCPPESLQLRFSKEYQRLLQQEGRGLLAGDESSSQAERDKLRCWEATDGKVT